MNHNRNNAVSLWWPVLILKALALGLKIVVLSFVHWDDARTVEKALVYRPRKVSYSARQGLALVYLGRWLFLIGVGIAAFILLY